MLTHTMLETGREALLELMKELRDGHCNNTPVKLGNLKQLMLTAGTERIDFMHDFEFTESPVTGAVETRSYLTYNPEKTWSLGHTQEFKLELETNTHLLLTSLRGSENLYEQIELLHTLIRLKGLSFDTGLGGAEETVQVVDLLNEVYTKAGESSQSKIQWAVIRHAAGLLDKVDISLSDAVTDILVRQKQIAVGKAYSEDSIISRPGSYTEVMDKIRQFCGEDVRDRVLTQEVLIYLGLLIKAEPQLFKGLLTLRVSYFILLLTSELARELQVTQNEAYEYLMQLSPFEIKNRLRQVLAEYEEMNQILKQQESLRVKQPEKDIEWVVAPVSEEATMPAGGWRRKRQMEGAVNRVPKDFYPNVWGLLRHCKGLIIGDKLERRNRLDSDIILSEMTPGEKNFALQIEHLLNKIVAPEYRQVNIEALMELAAIAQRNPELKVEEYIVLDVLVGHAVRLNWRGKYPERADKYDEDKAAAWQAFYNTSPYVCASHVLDAFRFLTKFG
jgi:phosphorylase kinase alpha/beta subunit